MPLILADDQVSLDRPQIPKHTRSPDKVAEMIFPKCGAPADRGLKKWQLAPNPLEVNHCYALVEPEVDIEAIPD